MDAELRVAADEGAEHPARLEPSLEQYGQHGWSTASGKPPPRSKLGGPRGALPPSPPSPSPLDPPASDPTASILSRRRRMLARSALAEPQHEPLGSAPPALKQPHAPSALASAGGRSRVAAHLNWSALGP